MWFFHSEEGETPLTKAIVKNDTAMIKALGSFRDHVLAKNYLGFSALDLANYLEKQEALKVFGYQTSSKKHKVLFPNQKDIIVLTDEEFFQHFRVKYISRLKFADYPFFKKVIRSFSWLFDEKLFGAEMSERYAEHKDKIDSGYFADVVIKWTDEVTKYGIFANKDIAAGEYIGEYAGIVNQLYRFYPIYNEYCMRYPLIGSMRSFLVDSEHEGNESRFINHSFHPNLDYKPAAENGLIHCVFIANQTISKGSQLTFNYGKSYWQYRMAPEDI